MDGDGEPNLPKSNFLGSRASSFTGSSPSTSSRFSVCQLRQRRLVLDWAAFASRVSKSMEPIAKSLTNAVECRDHVVVC